MDQNDSNRKGLKETLFQRGHALTYTLRGLEHRRFLNRAASMTIGRSRKCTIPISSRGVAPLHCRIERTGAGDLLLFSESDEAPVFVNGYPVEFQHLAPGDEIRIASVRFKVSSQTAVRGGAIGGGSVRYKGEFSRAFFGAIRKSHWLAVSLAVHLALILLLFNVEKESAVRGGAVGFVQDPAGSAFDSADLLEDAPPDAVEPALDELTPPEPLPAEFEAAAEAELGVADGRMFADSTQFFLGSDSARGPGGGSEGPLWRKRGDVGGGASGGADWQKHVGRLRGAGMDLAILFDSTGSMEGFIREVKDTIEEMVQVLEWIVPDLTMSLLTYKGDPRSSAYVVAHTPLVRDPYELLNFMRSVRISGGSAEGFAAIKAALDTAVEGLHWRAGTEKAILLIGDAPPFTEEVKGCVAAARKFHTLGTVGTIYKESGGVTLELQPETVRIFQRISEAGGGSFLRHDAGGDAVRRIVSAVLGTEWTEQIEDAFQRKRSPQWLRIIRRKEKEEDYDWLFERFRGRKVRPDLVDALVEMGGVRVAREMWRCLLRRGEDGPWLMHRALYVLGETADIEIDYMAAERDRLDNGRMAYIAEALRYAYGPEVLTEGMDAAH